MTYALFNPVRWFQQNQRTRNRELYIHHHLGLGDMIALNGMVRYFLSRESEQAAVHVFCKERYAEMVEWMYRDEPRIVLEVLPGNRKEGAEVRSVLKRDRVERFLSVGHRALRPFEKQFPDRFFDKLMYDLVNVPFSARFDLCHWDRDFAAEEEVFRRLAPNQPYAFIHDDPARGYTIHSENPSLPTVRNDTSVSVFHMGLVLERAAEVHCMESSLRCMMESLDMSRAKLFYHNFRYPDRPLGESTRHTWQIVDRREQRMVA